MTVGGVFTLSDECVPALRLPAPVQPLLIHRSKLPLRVIGKLCAFDLPQTTFHHVRFVERTSKLIEKKDTTRESV